MRMDILSIFPDMFTGVLQASIVKRALEKNIVEIYVHDFREFADNKHKKVDDTPYGGGAGMLLMVQPIVDCLKSIPNYDKAHIVLTTATGSQYHQDKAQVLSQYKHVIIICGHYEGIDERILHYVDEEISIGDYILTGGEIASLAIMDSIVRLLPEVIKQDSTLEESFTNNLLEYAQYTKPAEFDGLKVPDVLTSGNHEEIRKFRRYSALEKTHLRRPDLLDKVTLSKEDKKFLVQIERDKK